MSASPASTSSLSDISQIRGDSIDCQSGSGGGAGSGSGVGASGAVTGASSSGGGVTGCFQQVDEERRRSEQLRKLFVGGLAPFVSDDQLKEFFADFGDITDVVVMKDNKTGRSRGFGFVTYREPEMVDAAQAARPHVLGGKQVETKRAMPREDSDKPEAHMTVKKLFVGALKKDVTSDDLRDYFGQFGNVEEAEVMTWKETGESRGFGFVTFDDYDPVDKCILYKPHSIGSSRADVKKALSKEEMSKVKAKQEQQKFTGSPFSPGAAAAIKLAAAGQSAAAVAAAAAAAAANLNGVSSQQPQPPPPQQQQQQQSHHQQPPPPPQPVYYPATAYYGHPHQLHHHHQHQQQQHPQQQLGGGGFAYPMPHTTMPPMFGGPPAAADCLNPYALHAARGGIGIGGGGIGGYGAQVPCPPPGGFHFPAIFHAEPQQVPGQEFLGPQRWNEVCQ